VRKKGLLSNILLIFLSLTLCFIVGELTIRLLRPVYTADRFLMFSSKTFSLDSYGAVRYVPNETIRTLAVYNGKKEYDVRFPTNNMGFIDFIDYEYENAQEKKYYALVGDSFTAGTHGGEIWVPMLRKKIKGQNIEIYNLGVTGTGIEHFYKLLKSTIKQINITQIVVLALSSDFRRSFWYPVTDNDNIYFCPEDMQKSKCIEKSYVAKIISRDATDEEILKISKDISDDIKKLEKLNIINTLKKSHLLVSVVRMIKNWTKNNDDILYSLRSLRNIKKTFPLAEVHFIHLPEKQEVKMNKYILDYIGEEIEKHGITYFPALRKCEWSLDMFFLNDSHPNKYGYENITQCVSDYLFVQ
jgi:hypothetical protein